MSKSMNVFLYVTYGSFEIMLFQRDHARLDSMVLLMMKLDQLDQEIENALSANSSIGSTPTLPRRRQLVQSCILTFHFSAEVSGLNNFSTHNCSSQIQFAHLP